MSRGFPTVGKPGQASKLLADLVIYHDLELGWPRERNDRRYGNRETRANADAYFTAILNFADPSYSPIQIAAFKAERNFPGRRA